MSRAHHTKAETIPAEERSGAARELAEEADSESLKAIKGSADQLRKRKELIDAEIRNYPTPIPRCDAQFDHLLEERARLIRELHRLDATLGQ
jgi:hypothetical protein